MTKADDLGVHPVAALFPMLPDDELDELAADIKQNGLIHPIVLDANRVLIDGRNRLEACIRAGVQPTFTELNGHDPVAFILSANVNRRQLTPGQRAMAVAKAREFLPGKNYGDQGPIADEVRVSQARISQAETVVCWAPELVGAVMAGGSLNDAYREALRRKRQPEEEEKRRRAIELAIEAIGPEIPIPAASAWPDLAARLPAEAPKPATPKPAEDVDLAAQQEYLRALNAVARAAAKLRDRPVVTRGWWIEGHVVAVRAAVSHIVADALAVATANNEVAERPLRLVE